MKSRFENIKFENIKIIAEDIPKEIERRRINLWLHRIYYYKYNTTITSDFEYDKKEIEYKILREKYPEVKLRGYCPLDRVGIDIDRVTESKIDYLIRCIEMEKL